MILPRWGASCGALDAPVDVIVPGGAMRSRPGLAVHTDLLATDEVTAVHTVPLTTPVLTALHLACRPPVVEAIVAVDALAHAGGFAPEAVLRMGSRHLRSRGSAQLREVVRRANRLADSPMVLGKPRWVAGQVRWALVRAAHARGLPVEALDPR